MPDSNKAFNCSLVYCGIAGYLDKLDKLYLCAVSRRCIVMVGLKLHPQNLAVIDFSTYNLLISLGRGGNTRDFEPCVNFALLKTEGGNRGQSCVVQHVSYITKFSGFKLYGARLHRIQ